MARVNPLSVGYRNRHQRGNDPRVTYTRSSSSFRSKTARGCESSSRPACRVQLAQSQHESAAARRERTCCGLRREDGGDATGFPGILRIPVLHVFVSTDSTIRQPTSSCVTPRIVRSHDFPAIYLAPI